MVGSILRCAIITVVVVSGAIGIIRGSLYGLMYLGLCFGVDPLEVGVTEDGVNAFRATQRMGDSRLYICVVNHNKCPVSADIAVDVVDRRRKHSVQKLHTTLMAFEGKRIYSEDPAKVYSSVLGLKVSK